MFFGQRQVPLIRCNFTITKYINILIFIYELLYFSFNLILKKKDSMNYTVVITLLLYTLIFSLSYINILLSYIVIIRVVALAIPCKLWSC
jgi:hypothetical protein